jgi:hypothetical protein
MSLTVGQSHVFEDGGKIEIIQIKQREDGPWVTFHTTMNTSLPRKLTMTEKEFLETFGHLFGERDVPNS